MQAVKLLGMGSLILLIRFDAVLPITGEFLRRMLPKIFFMAEPISHPKHPHRTPSRHSSFFAADGRQRPKVTTLRYADTACASF